MCGLHGARKGNYFGGEPIGRTEVEVRVEKLKNGKVTSNKEITGEMIKGKDDRVVDSIWRLCKMALRVKLCCAWRLFICCWLI